MADIFRDKNDYYFDFIVSDNYNRLAQGVHFYWEFIAIIKRNKNIKRSPVNKSIV